MTEHKQISICAMPHAGGHHLAAWRRPNARGNDIWNPDLWRDIARTVERGRLDAIFFADNMSLWLVPEQLRHFTAKVGGWDALMVAAIAASVTEHIGIVATGHTEFHEPYSLARQLACLDHMSRGRASWNVVTSAGPQDTINFGREQLSTVERYARAEEYVDLLKKLWDSWDSDAYVIDKESGIFYDPDKMRRIDFEGEYYKSQGPLNVMRPPQGYPVIAQAGGSPSGKDFAARHGELIFTPFTGELSRRFSDDLRERAVAAGRSPSSMKILSLFAPIVGRTSAEAEEKWAEIRSMLQPDLARGIIEGKLGMDLSTYPLDEPLPEPTTETKGVQAMRDALLAIRRDGKRPTLRQLIDDYRDDGTVIGSPTTIADYMESEVDSGACDGFVMIIHGLPNDLDDFVDMVVPELQRRGRLRTEYEPGTFRSMLGLDSPQNQFAGADQIEATL